MIKRVYVRGYKSLEDVELRLEPLTIIFGPNAAGKSNFFDVLALLSHMVTRRSLRDAFEGHRGEPIEAFHYTEKGLPGLLATDRLQFTIEVDVQISNEVIEMVEDRIRQMRSGLTEHEASDSRHWVVERFLRYRLTVELLTESGILRVVDERLAALTADGTREKDLHARKPFIYEVDGRLRLRMEGQSRPTEHEVGLNYTLVSSELYAPHYPHVVAFREEVARWRFYYLEPHQMRLDAPLVESESLAPDGSEMATFYNTLKTQHPRQFETLNRSLRQLIPSIDGVDVIRTDQGKLRLQVYESGVPYSAQVISEGTLRILGLLAITTPSSPTTVVGYEEPENGVHPRRLQVIAELLAYAAESGKQVLINTHSPSFPEFFTPVHGRQAALVECRRSGRTTELKPFTPSGLMFVEHDVATQMGQAESAVTPLAQRMMRGDFGG